VKSNETITLELMSLSREEPTLASTWYSAAGTMITDEFLEWPADLFALTNVILKRSEAYRFVFSPPSGVEWPPTRFRNWSALVEEAGRQWSAWIDNPRRGIPAILAEEWSVLLKHAETPLEDLAEGATSFKCTLEIKK
jgi:hypothetical protein